VGLALPFQSAVKDAATPQGRYTIYVILIGSLIAIALHRPMVFVIQKLNPTTSPQLVADLATLIIVGICGVLVVILMFKMQAITAAIENRRLASFNERVKKRKES
jgi:predicted PurR-regulated permease PerM